ncbi:monofunctional biosynthetic peptidoglycan transglycosylase [Sphingobium nicotianae]|uniref:Biosynthetic peptidoglycan transglycosylase n=1 Tax=Sphingobium nicotianae TaxID=2782607 RepID=A0A9X1ISQ9_9SPHN|nr:monofunctional biosynthetic peptidoglycan transglycosylase [Sphingobium nicotianae]MBT2188851.1 monofunctional biosynthetic peptidoglycan transglycosylase [Sphingobium nicotianae]
MATTARARRGRGSAKRRWRFPGQPRSWYGKLFRWVAMAVCAFVVISFAQVLFFKFVPIPITLTMIMDGNGITKDWTSLSNIDPNMPRAAIAGEDAKFCLHHGFDTDAIRKAMERNAEGGRIRGGSTISQQTAKNVFLWQGGGYLRKALEAWYTVLIEAIWGKRRIMEVYLNVAETGIGTYGVEAGAIRYFNHSASHLSRTEAARIAAVLPLPKKREAASPGGFTLRHGNRIARYVTSVRVQGLDSCLK